MFQNRREKLMLRREKSEDQIALNLLKSMLTFLYFCAIAFKNVSLRNEVFNLETSRKKMKSRRKSTKKATSKLQTAFLEATHV